MTWEYEELYTEMIEAKYKEQKPFRDKAYKFIEENNCKLLTDGVYRFKDIDIYPEKLYCRNFRTNKKMSLENFYKTMEIKND
jgi:hypothetical protein